MSEAALFFGMVASVFTPKMVARGRYGISVVVGGVAAAVVVVVRVVAAAVSLLASRSTSMDTLKRVRDSKNLAVSKSRDRWTTTTCPPQNSPTQDEPATQEKTG